MKVRGFVLSGVMLFVGGCSSTSTSISGNGTGGVGPLPETDGGAGLGGVAALGGGAGLGGMVGTGGNVGVGGVAALGGRAGLGGMVGGTGGNVGVGGVAALGGRAGLGGVMGTGGNVGVGGVAALGGRAGLGGVMGAGGSTASGGTGTEPVLAFPGAQGWGAKISGGRGGKVIKVTTLNPTGPGSFGEAITASGPRIVVFAVSGVIKGDFTITKPDLTIAGQTAPGAGITIAGTLYTEYCRKDVQNIIIRHLRVRHICSDSDNTQCDAMQFSCTSRFILDHVSVSWGIDESLDLYTGANTFTIQDSVFENPCLGPAGSEYDGFHNYGILNGPDGGRGSVLRTAFLNSKARNPALADGPYDVINTLAYNFRLGLIHNNPASGNYNVVGNYYKKGPQKLLGYRPGNATGVSVPSASAPIAKPFYFDDEDPDKASYFFKDNYLDDHEEPLGAFDNPFTAKHSNLGAEEMLAETSQMASAFFDYTSDARYVPPTILPSTEVPSRILASAGAFPRDVVSLGTMANLRDGTGDFGCPNYSVDLMKGLAATTPPGDGDNDGMADAWETANGLDPNNGSDHSKVMASGYTAIEVYINGMASALAP